MKEQENMLESPGHTGNELTNDLHIGGSGQARNTNYSYMPFIMSIVVMCHHLSTEMVGENLQIMYKSTPTDTNPVYPIK